MSRRHGRPVRFPSGVQLPESPAPVPAIGPVVFSLVFDQQQRRIDLSDSPCPCLVRPLALALAGIAGQDGTVREWSGFQHMLRHLRAFLDFTAAAEPGQADNLGLGDVEPELLEAWESKLVADYGPGSGEPHVAMRTVVRLIRLVGQARPDALSVPMQARVAFATTTAFGLRPRPLDAYPVPVFERRSAVHLPRLTTAREQARRALEPADGKPLPPLQRAALTNHIAELEDLITQLVSEGQEPCQPMPTARSTKPSSG